MHPMTTHCGSSDVTLNNQMQLLQVREERVDNASGFEDSSRRWMGRTGDGEVIVRWSDSRLVPNNARPALEPAKRINARGASLAKSMLHADPLSTNQLLLLSVSVIGIAEAAIY